MIDLTLSTNTYRVYATLNDITVYVAGDIILGPAWDAITDNDYKARAAITATRFMAQLPWSGNAVTAPDAWPRNDILNVGNTETPDAVVAAYSILAAQLITTPNLLTKFTASANSSKGSVKRVKGGSAEVEFDTSASSIKVVSGVAQLVPPSVVDLLKPYLIAVSSTPGTGGAELFGASNG